jgi:hypothetical protein
MSRESAHNLEARSSYLVTVIKSSSRFCLALDTFNYFGKFP